MKSALIAIGVFVAAFMLVAIVTATPLVGEVVLLHTHSGGDDWAATPLWIVDTEGGSYLRAGSPESSGWVMRWHSNAEVKLERAGAVREARLFAAPDQREVINALMADRYGWADDFIGLLGGDRSGALPLRVDYVTPGAPGG